MLGVCCCQDNVPLSSEVSASCRGAAAADSRRVPAGQTPSSLEDLRLVPPPAG